MPKRPTAITGSAGEHFVAARISVMGYVVALPRGGSPAVDLLVSTPDGARSIAVQVKTSSDAYRPRKHEPDSFWEWPVGWKLAEVQVPDLWFVFVDLCGWPTATKESGEHWTPEALVVPSADVSRAIRTAKREEWSRPLFRVPWTKADAYWERWDLIEHSLRS